jgi:hypothetical protein
MSIPQNTVLLFRKALLLWLLGFTVSAWLGLDDINTMLGSPAFRPPGPFTLVTHTLLYLPATWIGICAPIVALVLVLLCVHDLLRGSRWWTALLMWWSYINLIHVAWLAGSGGQHLISNLLLWNILLSLNASPKAMWARASAFWIIRLQVLMAYLATGLHKLTGTHWVDGTAMGIVATDAAFGPAWMAELPLFAAIVTWAVLLFQFTFPIAVWWSRTRRPWMLFGALFHLGTALWMDIPEMAFAFLVAYTIWLHPNDVERLRSWLPFKRSRTTASGPSAAVG